MRALRRGAGRRRFRHCTSVAHGLRARLGPALQSQARREPVAGRHHHGHRPGLAGGGGRGSPPRACDQQQPRRLSGPDQCRYPRHRSDLRRHRRSARIRARRQGRGRARHRRRCPSHRQRGLPCHRQARARPPDHAREADLTDAVCRRLGRALRETQHLCRMGGCWVS